MTSSEWPPLPFRAWEETCDTLHMWTQIVGKTRMALAPPLNHWWHVALYVTPRGLTTSAIPCPQGCFDAEFDFHAHCLLLRVSNGEERRIGLFPRAVADFYAEYMAALGSLGIQPHFSRTPDEFDDPTPYDEDRRHSAYDRPAVERFHHALVWADRALQKFRARFVGKSSPVHFFWGSFDLALTRFSGRRAPHPPADHVMHEAYSHEEFSCGFWPGDRRYPQPAFYAYASPAPEGLEAAPVAPGSWDPNLREFLLPYENARQAEDPERAVLDFCQTTYEPAARLGNWDRPALERE